MFLRLFAQVVLRWNRYVVVSTMASLIEWLYVPEPGLKGHVVAWVRRYADGTSRTDQNPLLTVKGETIRAATGLPDVVGLAVVLSVERGGHLFEVTCEMTREQTVWRKVKL